MPGALALALALKTATTPGNAPLPGSSADLNFAGGAYSLGSLASQVANANSLGGYVPTSSGLYLPIAANTLRLSDLGLLIEQASTNSVRNNSMAGAVAGVVGSGGAFPTNWTRTWNSAGTGIVTTIVGTGTDFGLPYIDVRFSGTPTLANDGPIILPDIITASVGQTWTHSAFFKLVAGSLSGITSNFYILENNAGGVTSVTPTIGASFVRSIVTRTLAGASTTTISPSIQFITPQNVAFDFTVRIYAPQVEQLPIATSPIATTSAAVLRPADAVTLSGAALTAALAAKSAFIQTYNLQTNSANTNDVLIYWSGAGQALRFGGSTVVVADNAVNAQANGALGSGSWSGVVKSAYGFDATSYTAVGNGGAKGTSAFAFGTQSGTVSLGNRSTDNGRCINGFLQRVVFSATKGQYDGITTP